MFGRRKKPGFDPDAEIRATQKRRALAIKKIANRHLDAARLGGPGFKVKEQFLVSYEDMLRIWDIADHIAVDA